MNGPGAKHAKEVGDHDQRGMQWYNIHRSARAVIASTKAAAWKVFLLHVSVHLREACLLRQRWNTAQEIIERLIGAPVVRTGAGLLHRYTGSGCKPSGPDLRHQCVHSPRNSTASHMMSPRIHEHQPLEMIIHRAATGNILCTVHGSIGYHNDCRRLTNISDVSSVALTCKGQ
jgi:hypothetical protein